MNSFRTTHSKLAYRLLSFTVMMTVLVLFLLTLIAPARANVDPGCKPFSACPHTSISTAPSEVSVDTTVAASAHTVLMQSFPVQQAAAVISALQANAGQFAPVLVLGGGDERPRCPCHPYCCV